MDRVAAALDREFPDRTVESAERARRGNTKETTLVRFGDGDGVVVQFAADADAFRTELALSRAVRARTSVPAPRVLAVGAVDGRPYAVVDRASGTDLHERFARVDDEARRRLARRFGAFLAELHAAFAFDAYGAVRVAGGDDVDGGTTSELGGRTAGEKTGEDEAADTPFVATGSAAWPAWFRGYARDGIEALPAAFDGLRDELAAAVDAADLPRSPPSRLYPWDLRPGNAVFDGDEVTAVLDWGNPLAAAPGLSAAKTEHLVADWYVEDRSLRAAFREGYASVRPYPDVRPVYRLVAVVRSAVDGAGDVTRPRFPEVEGEGAVAFHRARMREWLSATTS